MKKGMSYEVKDWFANMERKAKYHFIAFDKETHNIIFEYDATGGSKSDCRKMMQLELIKRRLYKRMLDGLIYIRCINQSL